MKKMKFFLAAAFCMLAFTFVSCGDDDPVVTPTPSEQANSKAYFDKLGTNEAYFCGETLTNLKPRFSGNNETTIYPYMCLVNSQGDTLGTMVMDLDRSWIGKKFNLADQHQNNATPEDNLMGNLYMRIESRHLDLVYQIDHEFCQATIIGDNQEMEQTIYPWPSCVFKEGTFETVDKGDALYLAVHGTLQNGEVIAAKLLINWEDDDINNQQ